MSITSLEVGCSHVPPKIDESGGTVRKEQRRRHSPLHKELWKKIAVRSAPLITATHIYGEYSKKRPNLCIECVEFVLKLFWHEWAYLLTSL